MWLIYDIIKCMHIYCGMKWIYCNVWNARLNMFYCWSLMYIRQHWFMCINQLLFESQFYLNILHIYTSITQIYFFLFRVGFWLLGSNIRTLPTSNLHTSARNNFPTFCEKLLFHLFHYGNLTKCCVKSILYFGICLLINFHRHCWPSPFAISVKPNSRFPPSPYYGKCKKLSDICIFQMFQIFQMELSTRWQGNMFWNFCKTTFESPQPKWMTYLTIQRRKL